MVYFNILRYQKVDRVRKPFRISLQKQFVELRHTEKRTWTECYIYINVLYMFALWLSQKPHSVPQNCKHLNYNLSVPERN